MKVRALFLFPRCVLRALLVTTADNLFATYRMYVHKKKLFSKLFMDNYTYFRDEFGPAVGHRT